MTTGSDFFNEAMRRPAEPDDTEHDEPSPFDELRRAVRECIDRDGAELCGALPTAAGLDALSRAMRRMAQPRTSRL